MGKEADAFFTFLKTLVSLTVWEENIIEGKKSDVFGVRGLAPAAVSSLLRIQFFA